MLWETAGLTISEKPQRKEQRWIIVHKNLDTQFFR